MVSFPPLFPDSLWVGNFLRVLADKKSREYAISTANSKLSTPKLLSRFTITDPKDQGLTLSMAVEGGGRKLRDIENLPDLKLSEHGDWRKIHLGALEACLGKKPFYRDIENRLLTIYSNKNIETIENFNTAIFNVVLSFLMGNLRAEDLFQINLKPQLKERGKEIAKKIKKEISILQPLSEFGRETVLGIYLLE